MPRGTRAIARKRFRAIETPGLRVKRTIARSRAGAGGKIPPTPVQTDVAPGDDLGGQDAPEDSRASEAGQAVDAAGRAAALEWGSSCGAISG
jgi:hypothetical protein